MIAANSIIGGRYRVTRPLGGGGMKLVYLAEDLRLAARPCALAEMVDSFTDPGMQKQAVAGFQREADMLAQLSNEHIPRVYDRFSEQNHHYLVMEFVDGVTLEDELKKAGGKLPETVVIDIALQVLDTLEYLHNLQPPVIYRDLKPSNVMLTRDGKVKLIDFGIARFFQPMSNATMIGTQGYAPPEQYRGRAEARSDLYALGATMHHALSGRDPAAEPPFSFPRLKSLSPNLNTALAELVDQALQYDTVHRMADATEFKQKLLAIRSGVAPAPGNGAAARASTPSGKPQMRLPLGAGAARSSPEAATVLVGGGQMQCHSCTRSIPDDSRFCSFCGIDLTRAFSPNGSTADAEAATTVLPESIGSAAPPRRSPEPYVDWRPRSERRDPRPRRFIIGLIAALFAIAFLVTSVINHLEQTSTQPDSTSPDSVTPPNYTNPNPEGAEPMHRSPMAATLRQWLNMQGYTAVHFRIEGTTVILWGRVPNELERQWVRSQAVMVTGATSVVDHMVVQPDPFAGSP
jgi:serine/threonine protein kinase